MLNQNDDFFKWENVTSRLYAERNTFLWGSSIMSHHRFFTDADHDLFRTGLDGKFNGKLYLNTDEVFEVKNIDNDKFVKIIESENNRPKQKMP